jgi:hypothetical protein
MSFASFFCDQPPADARFDDGRKQRKQQQDRIEQNSPMKKGKRGVLRRGLQGRLCGKRRARRRGWSRGIEATSLREMSDTEIRTKDSEGLVYAALRVWELKHGFSD